MKTALVTGGAGFIGSHLCERLVREGYKVISLDNYFTGSRDNHVAGVEYREGHTKDISNLIKEKVDYIFHLGEYSRTAVAIEEPSVVFDLNVLGTLAVLEFWRTQGGKLIYAGSSTKFSIGVEGRDLSPYTWSKSINTDLIRNYHEWYGGEYATVYFYNVYGPRELSGKYGTVIEIYREKMRNKQPLTVNAPGTQKRNYTHVLDTVDAIVKVAEHGEGDGFGIASDQEYGTREVAEMFGGEIEMKEHRRTSRPASEVDTTKTKSLGWQPKYNLKDYIQELRSADFA